MISAFITGRLIKLPEHIDGRFHASLVSIADDRPVRLVCKRKQADQLRQMALGTPVSVAGLLAVIPVLNERGEARAHLRLEVTAILDVPAPTGLLGKLFKGAKQAPANSEKSR
jgi:hypothetical protein